MANRPMSDEHKAALAEGRRQARAVRSYLEALEAIRPKRGRRRTPESIRARLALIAEALDRAPVLKRLQLIQERRDLEVELEALEIGPSIDLRALEEGFTESARPYSQSKGITYAAWREIGVEPRVLAAAGINRAD